MLREISAARQPRGEQIEQPRRDHPADQGVATTEDLVECVVAGKELPFPRDFAQVGFEGQRHSEPGRHAEQRTITLRR